MLKLPVLTEVVVPLLLHVHVPTVVTPLKDVLLTIVTLTVADVDALVIAPVVIVGSL